MGAGIGAQAASLLNGIVADNLTATGSAQGDALALTGDVNVLSTVPIASGVRLPALPQPGDETLIANLGANTLTVYPPPGATIEGGPTNAPFSLPSGAAAEFIARVGSSNWITLASGGTVAGTPINSVLPKFVDGLGNTVTAPVVGQKLYIDVGGWTQSPSSFAWQVYDDTGAILDAYGTVSASSEQAYIVYDTEVGHPLHVGVVASNGLSSIEALSTATSNVIDRTIAKPTLTRTSASGVTPMTFSIAVGPDVFAGDNLHIQVCTDSLFAAANITQDIYHTLTEADLVTPFTPDLSDCVPTAFVDPGATDYMRIYDEAVTPQGRVFISPVSDSISPTDAALAVVWDTATKTANVNLTNGNLTANITTGNAQGVKASRGSASQKWHASVHIDAILAGGGFSVGVCDTAETYSPDWIGNMDNHGASVHSTGERYFNGADQGGGFTFTAGDDVDIEVDPVAKTAKFAKNGGAWTADCALAGATSNLLLVWQGYFGNGQQATANFVGPFPKTPTTGYTAIP